MVRFAVMTFMYAGWAQGDNGSHEELIEILRMAGADGIEAFANDFFGNNALLELYRKEMAAHHLAMPVMDVIADLAVPDGEQRKAAYQNMEMGIDMCDALGSEIVHVAGCRQVQGQTPADGRKRIVEGLMDFVDDVEERGMILAFENFDPSPMLICSAADCLEILDQTGGRVKFVFDTGNFEAVSEHAEDNLESFFDRTRHFHFKDFAVSGDPPVRRGTHFGRGSVKNADIARALKERDYDGWVALESYPQGSNGPRETVDVELATLKNLF